MIVVDTPKDRLSKAVLDLHPYIQYFTCHRRLAQEPPYTNRFAGFKLPIARPCVCIRALLAIMNSLHRFFAYIVLPPACFDMSLLVPVNIPALRHAVYFLFSSAAGKHIAGSVNWGCWSWVSL